MYMCMCAGLQYKNVLLMWVLVKTLCNLLIEGRCLQRPEVSASSITAKAALLGIVYNSSVWEKRKSNRLFQLC